LKENIVLLSLTNTFNFIGLIKFEEKIQFITEIKAWALCLAYA